MDKNSLCEHLQKAMPDAKISVISEDNVHFQAHIVSEAFDGLSLVKRQQVVYQAMGHLISSGEVHALSLTTKTPKEVAND